MRILHTSDWHLGKNLEGYSRLAEQELFMDELAEMVEEKRIDLIAIAGDIYDSSNPPAAAEQLFYKSMMRLSDGGRRPILIIAGNHDNPERLTASSPLAYQNGIILLGNPKSKAVTGDYGNYSITASGEGYLEINLRRETLVVLALPYPSEKRLNEVIYSHADEESGRRDYSQKVGEWFKNLERYYREDTVNLAMGHFYVTGGEESGSERDVSLGGIYAVSSAHLPEKADYIALGHLHRPQAVAGGCPHIYYSGSPLQYSKSEASQAKCVFIADMTAGEETHVERAFLRCHKPIEIWRHNSIEEAIQACTEKSETESFVYLEIKSDRTMLQSETKQIRGLIRNTMEINVLLRSGDNPEAEEPEEESVFEQFCSFYREKKGAEPSPEINALFLELTQEER